MYFGYRRTSSSMDTHFTFVYKQLSCKSLLRFVCVPYWKNRAIRNNVECKNYVKLPWIKIGTHFFFFFLQFWKEAPLLRISSPRFMFFPEGSAKASFFRRRLAVIFSIFDSNPSCFKPHFCIRVRYIPDALFTFETSEKTGQVPIFRFTLVHRI